MNVLKSKSIFFGFSLTLVLTIFLSGCYKDTAEKLYPGGGVTCDTLALKYAVNIQPILTANCAVSGCHTTINKGSAGGYAYDSHTETMASVPNKKLINSIKHNSGTSQMPKGSPPLATCDINKIAAWINQGALNN